MRFFSPAFDALAEGGSGAKQQNPHCTRGHAHAFRHVGRFEAPDVSQVKRLSGTVVHFFETLSERRGIGVETAGHLFVDLANFLGQIIAEHMPAAGLSAQFLECFPPSDAECPREKRLTRIVFLELADQDDGNLLKYVVGAMEVVQQRRNIRSYVRLRFSLVHR